MSENYVVFIEQPIKLDLLKFMLYKIQGKSFHRIMSWQPEYGTVFHVVNRHTGEVGRARFLSSPPPTPPRNPDLPPSTPGESGDLQGGGHVHAASDQRL